MWRVEWGKLNGGSQNVTVTLHVLLASIIHFTKLSTFETFEMCLI